MWKILILSAIMVTIMIPKLQKDKAPEDYYRFKSIVYFPSPL